jgi:2-oxoglutarate dehydrogenase E2 component (dihydrolipoamide succinyltransferase)
MNDMSRKPDNLQILVPLQQEGTKAVVRTWLVKAGDPVKQDQPVVELETDKVVVEVCAPADGVLSIMLEENAEALPGAVLGEVLAGALQMPPQPQASAAQAEPGKRMRSDSVSHFHPELRLSPAVRRLLAEHELDPATLQGTGRGGRLTREDVMAELRRPAVAAAPNPAASGPRVAEQVPHDSMRRRIAEHMQHSVSTAPHVTAVFEADFAAIIRHRQQHKAEFAAQGVNLTFTAYFIAAAVQAMQAAPQVNSRWHADFLEVFSDVNIGVGAALSDKGLIVPVIHRAQELSLLGIASRLQQVTEAARAGTLKPADVQGGTFTLSNHGVGGSLLATPVIINQPQSAILGIGALEKRVVVTEVDGVDTFQARPRAYVSLTIDHRVLDGSQTNAWLSRFVQVLQGWG